MVEQLVKLAIIVNRLRNAAGDGYAQKSGDRARLTARSPRRARRLDLVRLHVGNLHDQALSDEH